MVGDPFPFPASLPAPQHRTRRPWGAGVRAGAVPAWALLPRSARDKARPPRRSPHALPSTQPPRDVGPFPRSVAAGPSGRPRTAVWGSPARLDPLTPPRPRPRPRPSSAAPPPESAPRGGPGSCAGLLRRRAAGLSRTSAALGRAAGQAPRGCVSVSYTI